MDVKSVLHNPDSTTSLYISPQDRFQKDFASYDKIVREQ